MMVSHGVDICWATDNPWPDEDVLMDWALDHVNEHATHLKDHILRFWDIGALRTLWAYFFNDGPILEQFLLQYYLDWRTEGGEWCCINPSACLVWQVRSFWRHQPLSFWHLLFPWVTWYGFYNIYKT
jgi:hypothetical protein